MKYAILRADGSHKVVETDTRPDYHKIQELVAAPDEKGAMFEVIGGRNLTIFINENGKYLQLETNQTITLFTRANHLIWPHDEVKGDCVVMGEPDNNGNTTDVNDSVLSAILSYS